MDNTQTSSHSGAGADLISFGLTLCYVVMQIVNTFTKSETSFWLAVLVGTSTLAYNLIRIYKEIKK
ncbi:MAG: hypothetical protein EOO14_00345 [Chitinophagaceae bacterium]|nr:MAG: hypothetical protein EOO14_00345 [Chitinophagaceae bacterium]